MGISLFPHNQIAYESALRLMEQSGKAAVIHPTGTGKSMIAFKLAEEHPDAHICWLAPSEYIYLTQQENLGTTYSNIEFLTYTRLMMDESVIEELLPDYIVLDEFHRCGAAEWGKSVRKLLEHYPKAQVLGLSATNVRYLDGQRDMAEELFEGQIASEMSLGEAIVRGILPTPVYVTAMYSYQEELKKWSKRVAAQKNPGLRQENEKILEQLRRALEQAEGLDRIFARHMKKKDGKYLVFCADKEHMDEMAECSSEWFHLVDPKPQIYKAYYGSPETSSEFASFKQDNGRHLKLLYCIDMLNEGVHVEDIDGVILLRPTVSPILYLQQIGRSLSTGSGKHPVIFDVVNNYESLYSIDALQEEINLALMPCTQIEAEKFADQFRIIDEVRECRELFTQLDRNLSASWDIYYRAAGEYHRTHGNLRIPKTYVTDNGLTLGAWIQTQRRVYAGKVPGELNKEKINKLDALGMIWDARSDRWEEGYRELVQYHTEHGNIDVKARYVAEDGYPLGKWISNLRASVRKKGMDQVLSEKQQQQLAALGMIWNKSDEKWEQYINAAKTYRENHGDLRIPVKYVTDDGIPLGSWLNGIRNGLSGKRSRQETLSGEQIAQLEALGIEWEKDNVRLWNQKYALARDYYEQHGDLNIPVAYCVDGVRLGRWISNIRGKRRNPQSSGMILDENRIRQLDSIGMNWK